MNGFTKIKIDEQEIGLRFAFPAIKWFTEYALGKIDLVYVENSFTVLGVAKLLECAHKNDCLLKEVEPSITFEQFHDWVEDKEANDAKELERVLQVYAESTVSKKLQKKSEVTQEENQSTENTST